MNNSRVLQLQFNIQSGDTNCALHALIKPTEHPQKFHILRVQSLHSWENASVIGDFYITKLTKDNISTWVHVDSEVSSNIVQAIGNALDQHSAF